MGGQKNGEINTIRIFEHGAADRPLEITSTVRGLMYPGLNFNPSRRTANLTMGTESFIV